MKRRGAIAWLACATATATMMLAPAAPSQAQQVYSSVPAQAPYLQEQLDQMLAPIALYPDALLAQVLMAATYPLDVVEADRFVRQNPGLAGDALADAVEGMAWDPSVRALTQFPSVLAMMSERLEWTEQLGDAFLAQRDQVMDTVQSLRARAWAAGTLRSTEQQQVIVQDQVIAIEPARPGYLWVPYYNPVVVFGTWWWPDRPPFFWVPPPAWRPPHFSAVYGSGLAWSPVVPLRPRLWHDPRPVWPGRFGPQRPGPGPLDRAGPDPRWNRPAPPNGRWHGGAPDARPPRPPAAIAPPPMPRQTPEPSRDFRSGRGLADRDFAQPRNDFGRPRADQRGEGTRRGGPPRPRQPESLPQRVQKPMPVPRVEPQPAQRTAPPHPWTNRQPPRLEAPAPRAEPRPQVAPPPRAQPGVHGRPPPGRPEARGPRPGERRER
ncbi:MAG: DUF3300 domain-containing protein [Burkholderiaceae bacterium]|nr:DUF3300 domain-containing protein [Burkholderiaceae bacterium]